jgi:GNAT superfamily N-acetyltransferase
MPERIFAATTAEDYAAFAGLVREYVAWTRARLADDAWFIDAVFGHQSLESEMKALPTTYGPPHGKVLLAAFGGEVHGGGAYRKLSGGICEMKRLFVLDRFRGQGTGRRLCKAIIASARNEGYRLMRLDTSRRLTEAIAMYRSFGFRECPPYRDYPENLMPYLLFLELPLTDS